MRILMWGFRETWKGKPEGVWYLGLERVGYNRELYFGVGH